ncbi:MAG TPA: cation diffusion facilitator family transporter [Gaiellaceae bacterium]|nr:cation diffusion facilitator family transporter [Gaiellaceae bacterium]
MHAHHHDHARLTANRRALAAALALVVGFAVVEAVGGVLAGSLALLADAAHMLGDAAALSLALFAAWIAGRPATPERSYGFRRAEILAALANGVALVAIGIWILVEGVARLRDPAEPLAGWMLAVGVLGLVVNVAVAVVVGRARSGSLNLEAAFRHVLADLAGSVGVVAAALVILATGWTRADALIGLGIGVLVIASSWTVLRESVGVLLEAAPRGIEPEEVGRAMAAVVGVREVHDLHIWTITSGFPALSAHVLVAPGADCHAIRLELERLLHDRFELDHTTLQVEHATAGSQPVELGAAVRRSGPVGRR